MNPIRPAGLFAALACLAFGFALCAQHSGSDAQEISTTYATSMPSNPMTDAAPDRETPIPMTTPHVLNPIHFVSPTPWKFEDRPVATARIRAKPTPVPKRTTTTRYATGTRPKTKATPRPRFTARATAKPAVKSIVRPTPKAMPRSMATSRPTPTPTFSPLPTATPTATPSPSPLPRRKRGGRITLTDASPVPVSTSTSQPTSSAVSAPAGGEYVPSAATFGPSDSGAPTPIPTQPPTPRPLAPNQPTIPDSMADSNVRGIIARPIRQLSEIGWMQGTWNVTGVTNKQDGTSIPRDPSTYVFSPIMNNRWMFGADGRATDYIYLTFDPFTRHWVALRFGNNPSYGMWQSEKGWVGNRIDFLTNFSYVNGRQYRRRLTIIHKDARTFGIYETEQTPDGSFIPDDAYEFKKT